jgi:hypothetical protein
MQVFTLFIAIVALIVAIAAFVRTGGIKMLSREATEAKTLAARATADALEKIEERLREAPSGSRSVASEGPTVSERVTDRPKPEERR